jgi:UDP-galactopyranose mutase
MLDSENIEVVLNCGKKEWREEPRDILVYSGKIDEYYDYCYGELPYRSLEFHHRAFVPRQETFIINQNRAEVPYTRIYDHSYFNPDHGENEPTVITSELPKACGTNDIPYYPIPWGEGQKLYNQYEALKKLDEDVIFVGRLTNYKYLDMWMAVKHALIAFNKKTKV